MAFLKCEVESKLIPISSSLNYFSMHEKSVILMRDLGDELDEDVQDLKHVKGMSKIETENQLTFV